MSIIEKLKKLEYYGDICYTDPGDVNAKKGYQKAISEIIPIIKAYQQEIVNYTEAVQEAIERQLAPGGRTPLIDNIIKDLDEIKEQYVLEKRKKE